MNEPVNHPTPEEAAAALRTVRESRDQVIRSAAGSRWLSVIGGLIVFAYCVIDDLVPRTHPWLLLSMVGAALVLLFVVRTRVGSALLGLPVKVSDRVIPDSLRWRLLLVAPVLGIGIAVVVLVQLLHLSHGQIYYGAVIAIYIMFLGRRFQLWLVRRQDKD